MNRLQHKMKENRCESPGNCSSIFLIALVPTALVAILLCGVRQFLTDRPVFASGDSAAASSMVSPEPHPSEIVMARKAGAVRDRYGRLIPAPRRKKLVATQPTGASR